MRFVWHRLLEKYLEYICVMILRLNIPLHHLENRFTKWGNSRVTTIRVPDIKNKFLSFRKLWDYTSRRLGMTTLQFQSQACVAGILLQTRTFIPYPGILVLDIRTFSCTNYFITARKTFISYHVAVCYTFPLIRKMFLKQKLSFLEMEKNIELATLWSLPTPI